MLLDTTLLQKKFDQALPYETFLTLVEADGHRGKWDQRYEQLELSPDQKVLIGSFARRMKVLCLTGPWCGDCALQGTAMKRVAEACPDMIEMRYLPRSEEHADLIVESTINAGFRVPVTWFMAEDCEPLIRMGDRTLSRYRAIARKALGPAANVVAPAPEDPVRTVLQEVVDQFERAHLLLRLSPRMRQMYGD